MEAPEGFETFLSNVNKISMLVKELNSSDADVQQKAMEKSDCYIAALKEPCRTKINKTKINANSPYHLSPRPQNESPETFMNTFEKYAEDRRIRRIAKEEKATALKHKGNEAYFQEDYETAVKYYTEGLAEVRDMLPLYTNRAQAYIKLGKYKEAISDCEWALKCDEKCTKAFLHMGKAYLALKDYNESRKCFDKIVETEPRMENMMTEYLTLVDQEEEREKQEISAREKFDEGEENASVVPQLLERLLTPGQTPLFYCGALEILSQAASDCTGQTLFRLNSGFRIISSNNTLRSCLLQKRKEPYSQELCASLLKLWRVICCENGENQKVLMTCPVSRQSIVELLTSDDDAVQKECLALLCLYSQKPQGRRVAIDNLNLHMLAKNLMVCISMPKQQQITAIKILENFATEKKFCIQFRDLLTYSVIVPFTATLRNISASNRHILPSLISALGCLARDDVICRDLAHDPECWKAFLVAMKQCSECEYREILYPILGLIINLSNVISPVIKEHAVSLCECCLGVLKDSDGGIITRATGVLSNVLPQSSEAVQRAIQGDVVKTMHWLLKGKGQNAIKYAIKTLSACTAVSHWAREELVKSDKKLASLRRLLGSSCDEVVSGNAALCMAHCFEVEGVASNLLGTDIVLVLLRHAAGDSKRTAVQRNAAIALGKLCRSEPRHKTKLRELHGLDILLSCMKLVG